MDCRLVDTTLGHDFELRYTTVVFTSLNKWVDIVVFLVGDIGGTNTRLALFDGAEMRHKQTFRNAEMAGFDSCLERFLKDVSVAPAAAVFGLAGPVDDGRIRMTNLN